MFSDFAKRSKKPRFQRSIQIYISLSFGSWITDRKTVVTGREYQLNNSSSSDLNSAKNLKAADQTQARAGPANIANNIAIFDHVDVR